MWPLDKSRNKRSSSFPPFFPLFYSLYLSLWARFVVPDEGFGVGGTKAVGTVNPGEGNSRMKRPRPMSGCA